jgi:hypothetical protein
MYEHSDRYPGCIMLSALPDAPVIDRPDIRVRVVRALRDAWRGRPRRARTARRDERANEKALWRAS